MSGSVLFFKGLRHQPSGQQVGSGVARFGDRDRVNQTVFASLHDLQRVWESHERMEAAKPPHQRHPGGPYVYFAHNDMANTANACGGQPPPSYCDCRPGGPGPGCLLRPRDFDFRGHCERQPLPHLPEEAEACGIEWNELRAALSYDNLVGLALIHDPGHDPRQHKAAADALRQRVAEAAAHAAREAALARSGGAAPENASRVEDEGGAEQQGGRGEAQVLAGRGDGGEATAAEAEAEQEEGEQEVAARGERVLTSPAVPRLEMYVFVLEQEHGVNGHLLVEEQEVGEGEMGEAERSGRRRRTVGRAVTLDEYLARWQQRHGSGAESQATKARGEMRLEPAGAVAAEA